MTDEFRGDDAALINSINALLSLDADGALVPHGIGGHARGLLSAAAVRLAALTSAPAEPCATCGETEPRTGNCGTSDSDTRALCKRIAPPQTPQAAVHADLMRFYAVDSVDALIAAQAGHIEKLQSKLQPAPSFAPQRVREG